MAAPALDTLQIGATRYRWLNLRQVLPEATLARLPYSLRILIENIARRAPEALAPLLEHVQGRAAACEVPFYPNRMMLHDTTCLPALADFAGLRDAVAELGGDPTRVNPTIPVVLTVDHSVIVESYASNDAVQVNLDIDFRRNSERYRFIKWAQGSLHDFHVVPPGTGIIHQVNMESLAQVVWETRTEEGEPLLHPDAMVATDSHTPMINALGVVAWGVGGLEGQAAMLGEPVPIICPEVIGLRVSGQPRAGLTATDLALHLTELLRRRGVVAKFVEFCGPGLDHIDAGTRATIANMAPEYGATVVYFPFDATALGYLRLSGRTPEHCAKVETYMRAQGLWRTDVEPAYTEIIELDLDSVEPCLAGPYLPQQRRPLSAVAQSFHDEVVVKHAREPQAHYATRAFHAPLAHGALVLAAITSCTNTANPHLMIQAGLLARNAAARGLASKPWVKTSLSPGSRVVADYLQDAGLMPGLEALGFHLTGYGCMTCIGSSGPLQADADALIDAGLLGAGVLSGNRNFEGRVHPKLAGGYLASPALVVAYAIAGTVMTDLSRDPLGRDHEGRDVFLADLWPGDAEVQSTLNAHVRPQQFIARNRTLWDGTAHWQALSATASERYRWEDRSTYLRRPAYTEGVPAQAPAALSVTGARPFLIMGDNITTDHISPVGTVPKDSAAGAWLLERGEKPADLNQYSTRRSNHEVMLRGAFTTRNLKNLLLAEKNPGNGAHAYAADGATVMSVYEAARTYGAAGIPLIVFAGLNYGAGSSRDWAAKAQALLGVRAVVAKSFERIHRSNLIGMGVLPLLFASGTGAADLGLTGRERLDLSGLEGIAVGNNTLMLHITREDGSKTEIPVDLGLDSAQELLYLRNGGILPYVLRKTLAVSH
jgi:aconitate hydratase